MKNLKVNASIINNIQEAYDIQFKNVMAIDVLGEILLLNLILCIAHSNASETHIGLGGQIHANNASTSPTIPISEEFGAVLRDLKEKTRGI